MNDKDRIRLAEAMGYSWQEDKKIKEWPGMGHWYAPNGDRLPHSHERVRGCGHGVAPTFDPFTDANDDYAVLEWMRTKFGWHNVDSLPEQIRNASWRTQVRLTIGTTGMGLADQYRVGDFARAALKVLNDDK